MSVNNAFVFSVWNARIRHAICCRFGFIPSLLWLLFCILMWREEEIVVPSSTDENNQSRMQVEALIFDNESNPISSNRDEASEQRKWSTSQSLFLAIAFSFSRLSIALTVSDNCICYERFFYFDFLLSYCHFFINYISAVDDPIFSSRHYSLSDWIRLPERKQCPTVSSAHFLSSGLFEKWGRESHRHVSTSLLPEAKGWDGTDKTRSTRSIFKAHIHGEKDERRRQSKSGIQRAKRRKPSDRVPINNSLSRAHSSPNFIHALETKVPLKSNQGEQCEWQEKTAGNTIDLAMFIEHSNDNNDGIGQTREKKKKENLIDRETTHQLSIERLFRVCLRFQSVTDTREHIEMNKQLSFVFSGIFLLFSCNQPRISFGQHASYRHYSRHPTEQTSYDNETLINSEDDSHMCHLSVRCPNAPSLCK